jgi:hypothetical protein
LLVVRLPRRSPPAKAGRSSLVARRSEGIMNKNAKKFKLKREKDGTLTLIRSNKKRSKNVRSVVLNPMSISAKWYELQSEDGRTLETIPDLAALDVPTRKLLEEDIRDRYVLPEIKKIVSLRQESSISYWEVETDRGPRDFVIKERLDNIIEDGSGGYSIKDVVGNYFVVKDPGKLDAKSRRLFDKVI